MKIVADREQLVKEFERAIYFVDKNPYLAIMDSFLLTTTDMGINLLATNESMQYSADFNVEVKKPGTACIPAKRILYTIKRLRDTHVTIELKEAGKNGFVATVSSHKSNKYQISCHSTNDYYRRPIPDCPNEMSFRGKDLIDALDSIKSFVNPKDGRPGLTGVNLSEKGNKAIVMGANGSVLGRIVINPKAIVNWSGINMHLDTTTAISSIVSEKESVDLLHNGNALIVQADNFSILSSLIDAKFPDMGFILDKKPDTFLKLHSLEMSDCLSRLKLYCTEGYSTAVLEVKDDKIVVQAEDIIYQNKAEEDVTISSADPLKMELAFNIDYLRSVIGSFEAEYFNFYYSAPNKPVFVEPVIDTAENNKLFICMPVHRGEFDKERQVAKEEKEVKADKASRK
jgi:DNA polymerase III subunit beta